MKKQLFLVVLTTTLQGIKINNPSQSKNIREGVLTSGEKYTITGPSQSSTEFIHETANPQVMKSYIERLPDRIASDCFDDEDNRQINSYEANLVGHPTSSGPSNVSQLGTEVEQTLEKYRRDNQDILLMIEHNSSNEVEKALNEEIAQLNKELGAVNQEINERKNNKSKEKSALNKEIIDHKIRELQNQGQRISESIKGLSDRKAIIQEQKQLGEKIKNIIKQLEDYVAKFKERRICSTVDFNGYMKKHGLEYTLEKQERQKRAWADY